MHYAPLKAAMQRFDSTPSGWQDSNLRPPAPKAGILPTVLHPDK